MVTDLRDTEVSENNGIVVNSLLKEACSGEKVPPGLVFRMDDSMFSTRHTDLPGFDGDEEETSFDNYILFEWQLLRSRIDEKLRDALLTVPVKLGQGPWIVCASAGGQHHHSPFMVKNMAGLLDAVQLTWARTAWPAAHLHGGTSMFLVILLMQNSSTDLTYDAECWIPAGSDQWARNISLPFFNDAFPDTSVYRRFSFGLEYNRLLKPMDPFDFMNVFASPENPPEDIIGGLRESVRISEEALAQHTLTETEAVPGYVRQTELEVRQLIGYPAAEGFTDGVVYRSEQVPPLCESCESCEKIILLTTGWGRQENALQKRLKGLILPKGGVVGDAALMARRLGIPAIVRTEETRLLRDGAAVALDGTTGILTIQN